MGGISFSCFLCCCFPSVSRSLTHHICLYCGLLRCIVGSAQVRGFCLPQQDRHSSSLCSSPSSFQACNPAELAGALFLFYPPAGGACACVCVCAHTQVMLLMLPMMIRVMNRHSQGRGCCVVMSSWLRGWELEGSMTSALGDRRRGEERGGKKTGKE